MPPSPYGAVSLCLRGRALTAPSIVSIARAKCTAWSIVLCRGGHPFAALVSEGEGEVQDASDSARQQSTTTGAETILDDFEPWVQVEGRKS